MKEESLRVSTVIPVYNGEWYLKAAIQSVMEQTYKNMEVIVVDDGSEDDSASIAGSFKDIKIIQQPHRGDASARNTGLKHATGGFISFLDADDLWKPEKTEKQMALLLQNDHIDGTFCRFQNFFDPESAVPEWVNKDNFTRKKFQNMPSLVTLLMRKDKFHKVGLFNETLEVGSDIDWLVRAKEQNINLRLYPEICVLRRLHSKNLSYKAASNPKELLGVFKASLDRKRHQNKTS